MWAHATENFCHRRNDDRTLDSICLRCFRTVGQTTMRDGQAAAEEYLDGIEQEHICETADLLPSMFTAAIAINAA